MKVVIKNSALSLKQRIDLIKELCLKNNINLIYEKKHDDYFHLFKICCSGIEKYLFLFLKNVVNSGWSGKPEIKRIQVPSFLGKIIPTKSENSVVQFIGIVFANDKPILVAWNPYSFVYHKTNRSCYVSIDSIAETFQCGLIKTVNYKKEIILCSENNFGKFIELCGE